MHLTSRQDCLFTRAKGARRGDSAPAAPQRLPPGPTLPLSHPSSPPGPHSGWAWLSLLADWQTLSPTSSASFRILTASRVSGSSRQAEIRQKRRGELELPPKTHKLVPERNGASFLPISSLPPTIARQAACGPWLEQNPGVGVGNGIGAGMAPLRGAQRPQGLPGIKLLRGELG